MYERNIDLLTCMFAHTLCCGPALQVYFYTCYLVLFASQSAVENWTKEPQVFQHAGHAVKLLRINLGLLRHVGQQYIQGIGECGVELFFGHFKVFFAISYTCNKLTGNSFHKAAI